MPLRMICSRSRHGRTGNFNVFFFDSHCSCCRSNPEIRWRPLFPNTAFQRGKGKSRSKEREEEAAHHNLVCRIEPMQARPKKTCECSKTPDQTKPDHSAKSTSQSRATSIHFSYKQEGVFLGKISVHFSPSLSPVRRSMIDFQDFLVGGN